MYKIGDIVLVPKGQKTNFFEVINIEEGCLYISDGYVQIRKSPDEVKLICKVRDRQDDKIPFVYFMG